MSVKAMCFSGKKKTRHFRMGTFHRTVPCHKYKQCGETTFDLAVGERLEQIVDTLRDSISEIAVVQYSSVAA